MALDLAQMWVRKSVRALSGAHCDCDKCRRSLLSGELLHEFEGGRRVCSLCLAQMPEHRRTPVRSERVHASERHLPVAARPA